MVHLRLNEKESRPNEYVNFITQIPRADGYEPSGEDAKELLCALAAQVKPLMKDHGFTVNSLEEEETGKVGKQSSSSSAVRTDLFIVPTNSSVPSATSSTQFLSKKTGYYSSGTRLRDAAAIRGQGIGGIGEILPEYVCGGAHTQKRSGFMATRRKRRERKEVMPGNHTGAQTAKKRKAGSRMTKPLPGEGVKMSEEGGSKGKRANSNRARDERAAAAERRMLALQGKLPESPVPDLHDATPSDGDDNDEFEPEDDDLRRLAMNEVMSREEINGLRLCDQKDDGNDERQPKVGPSRAIPTTPPASASTHTNLAQSVASKKRKGVLDGMVRDEIAKRKRESLGMDGPGKTMGSKLSSDGKPGGSTSSETSDVKSKARVLPWLTQGTGGNTKTDDRRPPSAGGDDREGHGVPWACIACTL
ncbi:hypothetical protein FRB96_003360 [Tulasnella sp. 330]|nr:hypothetical protein FRB96_003360 [Tulasnella sp. 330]KAG8879710.1 hypothetical protein FRB97_001507 [Tulasnella sp. 331]KAG8885538.1 hypothetical protein FRB98_001766 [Tulasnella sp. 332]